MMRIVGVIARIAALVVAFGWVGRSPVSAPTTVHIFGSLPNYDVADLAQYADAVALISPVGQPVVHWNSADNEPWAPDAFGVRSHIYRDQSVKVVRVIEGSLPGDMLVLRGLGGTIRDVEIRYEDAASFVIGEQYIAFLRQVDTPTRDGFERAWTLVWQRHGLFREISPGEWSNVIDKTLPPSFVNGGQ